MEGFIQNYYLKTFGCQMNYADSEKVNMALLQSGFRKVLDPAAASVVILNTCSVRQKGEDRVFGYVREVKKLSQELGRPILIGITGCMVRKTGIARRYLSEGVEKVPTKGKIEFLTAEKGIVENLFAGDGFQQSPFPTAPKSHPSVLNWDDELFSRSESIDFVFRIEEIGYLPKLLSVITGQQIGNDEKWEEYLRMRGVRENPAQANAIIQTGCDNFCTFCIVPHTRGRETSRPREEIVQEIAEAASTGAKEVTLLGQNVNSYGKESRGKLWNADSLTWNADLKKGLGAEKTPFRELLEAVDGISGIRRIRFTSSNPHDMTRDILDAHFELESMMPYLHLALQSGSDAVLRRMNRKHTYADFKSQVEYLRSKDPFFAVSTDLIVGFPGETEEEFQATLFAMEDIEFDYAYLARYSPRKGTFAADRLWDDVPAEAKADRWNRANGLLKTIATRRLEKMVGRIDEILITGPGKTGGFVGRTRNFKETFIPETKTAVPGDIVPVRILETDGFVLKGEMLDIPTPLQ